MFCQLLRPDLDRVLAQQPPAKGPLLDLFYAVHHLERKAERLFPSALGMGGPPLCAVVFHVCSWCRSAPCPVVFPPILIMLSQPGCKKLTSASEFAPHKVALLSCWTTESRRGGTLLENLLGDECW